MTTFYEPISDKSGKTSEKKLNPQNEKKQKQEWEQLRK